MSARGLENRYREWRYRFQHVPFSIYRNILLILIETLSDAHFFAYCDDMFASSWEGKLKPGWGWKVKNEAREEVVRSIRDRAGEIVSLEALPSSGSALTRGE